MEPILFWDSMIFSKKKKYAYLIILLFLAYSF